MTIKIICFYYGIPKNKVEKSLLSLLIDANKKGNKLIPDPDLHILSKRYRSVLKASIENKNENKNASRLIIVRTKSCVALMRKYIKSGKTECFCDVSISTHKQN